MHKRFQQIGLIGKHGDPMVKETLLRLYDYLISQQREVVIEEATCRLLEGKPLPGVPEIELPRHSDLVIVVGGDGTLLHAARVLASQNIPLLGINLGQLGFLVDLSPDQIIPRLDEILNGQYEQECRFLLEVSIGDESSPHQNILAFNDVVLHKWNIARIIEFETFVDDQLVNDQRSDGLIVSTPTGSTAYALSGGGPLLYPSLNAIVMVPICSHTLSNRPIVVDGDSKIEIRLNPSHTEDVQITCDGQTTIPAMPKEVIRIRKAEHQARLIHPKSYDYYSILRAKLGWSKNSKKNRC
ncbi:MAG: NAD(+) kinase [Candidatus Thiodiazotropha sp. (ex Lucinoma aequizonata)]|nr:NAD(+) kinase [Candidatus Thiodiazotropha sp. (ex Lucinoma aequizonata)]MCU7889096.1 NAD(+) kinase [Candidatus Thiodiazotropha sp. (ex Lucinoma aequizonata)]MCU7895695.1 NAD(+) kinase [Candidatus Thiodiazotropha sp. (ex Lucinoma aequizonata)]MCU7897921.1 NAD(+) kinase [Candidatus Thiodiazotropha sp. (ex Lucinoma aequizonata)]MCU7900720.1 NAD(+) kinase [Candidatus Thiodiazotropha sp. (ex Lucinoma aequizonata)]